jgi:hypothetical protein
MSKRTKILLLAGCFGLLILVFVALSGNKEEAVDDVGSKHSDTNTNIQLINNIDDLYAVSYLGTHDSITSLSVSSVAPEGRQNAVEWIIEDAGYDMTTTRVIFEDFVNPFGDGDKKDDYEL